MADLIYPQGTPVPSLNYTPGFEIYPEDETPDVSTTVDPGPGGAYPISGYTTTDNVSVSTYTDPNTTTAPAPTGGVDLQDPNTNPGDSYFWDAADGWKLSDGGQEGPLQAEIDAIFNPTFNYLNQAESNLRGDYPSILAEADERKRLSDEELLSAKRGGEEQIAGEERKSKATFEDAVTAARRLLGELQIGGRQRFGGASSAGEAFSELSKRGFQRNVGSATDLRQEAQTQLAGQVRKIGEQYEMGKRQLELQTNEAKNQMGRDFQNKLLEITRIKGETESAKAQMRLDALQALRNQAFAIQLQNQQFAQQLEMQRQNSMGAIQSSAAEIAGSASAGGGIYGAQAAGTNLNPTGPSVSRGGTQTFQNPTGRVGNRDEIIGQVAPFLSSAYGNREDII